MGYYTRFELTVHEGTADLQAVKDALDDVMEFSHDDSCFDLDDPDTITTSDSMKWYDHDEECAEMSQKFPGVVFKLHGEGEETGDLWDSYYKDGKCQICRAEFIFPEYDSAKLTSVRQAQSEDQGRR